MPLPPVTAIHIHVFNQQKYFAWFCLKLMCCVVPGQPSRIRRKLALDGGGMTVDTICCHLQADRPG